MSSKTNESLPKDKKSIALSDLSLIASILLYVLSCSVILSATHAKSCADVIILLSSGDESATLRETTILCGQTSTATTVATS